MNISWTTVRESNKNKTFIDIRLRPGIATLLATYRYTSSIKPTVCITYCNAARGGPSHGHRGSVQKIREYRSSGFK